MVVEKVQLHSLVSGSLLNKKMKQALEVTDRSMNRYRLLVLDVGVEVEPPVIHWLPDLGYTPYTNFYNIP